MKVRKNNVGQVSEAVEYNEHRHIHSRRCLPVTYCDGHQPKVTDKVLKREVVFVAALRTTATSILN